MQVVNVGPGDMRMYYHSYDAAQLRYRVGLATSPDGFTWKKEGPVFSGSSGEASAHDARGAASCHVVYDSEVGRRVAQLRIMVGPSRLTPSVNCGAPKAAMNSFPSMSLTKLQLRTAFGRDTVHEGNQIWGTQCG